MSQFDSFSNQSVNDDMAPSNKLRLISLLVFGIGALISIPTFVIGLEQEGSWLISQIGIILFCITIISSLIIDLVHNGQHADWKSARGHSTLSTKITMAINTLLALIFTIFMILIIFTIEIN